MIRITRRQAQLLRQIFRASALGLRGRSHVPVLVIECDEQGTRARSSGPETAIEYRLNNDGSGREQVVLPLTALGEIEARDDALVSFDTETSPIVKARWHDHGIPVTKTFDTTGLPTSIEFPALPSDFRECSNDVIDALAAVSEIAVDDSVRYALSSIEIRGEAGEVVATDGHQLLLRSGLRFPWSETLLIRHSPIFAMKVWLTNRDLKIAKTDSHIVLRSGPCTIAFAIQTKARFPKVRDVIPDSTQAMTRLKLDPTDAQFLTDALGKLPGDEVMNAPVTLDLNGKVRVRAVDAQGGSATELILARSSYSGTPLRVSTNRNFLAFAAKSGATEIRVQSNNTPLTAESANAIYVWQPLDGESVLESLSDAVSIDSKTFIDTSRAPSPPRIFKMKPTMHVPGEPAPNEVATPSSPNNLTTLIAEAESLHNMLTTARTRSSQLLLALRRHRKQNRLVQETLRSLHQLKLHDVAG